MEQEELEDRRTLMAARRYHEIVRSGGNARRYLVSILVAPTIVALTVPGPWWAFAAALPAMAAVCENLANRWARAQFARFEQASETAPRQFAMRLLLLGAVVVALCTAPNLVLAFAPSPGPWIGYICALLGLITLMVAKSTTRAMMALSSPVIGAAMIANAMAIQGWIGIAMGIFGVAINMLANARTSTIATSELIDRQLDLESAAALLERRVEERTRELSSALLDAKDATLAAERANQAKSLFLASMTHELRTPLNAIIGYTEIVREDLASGDSAGCDGDLANVHRAAQHLLKLIDDVLDISKMDAERPTMDTEHLDNQQLAQDALAEIVPIALSNKTTCDLIISPGAETIRANRPRVKQCLINLLSNAAKFTHNGRVVLQIRETEHADAPAIAYEVSDTGIGIAENVQDSLFEPFFQADNTMTRAYGGIGLGLSITRQLARLMGGDVTLESELGKGSHFTLIVPRAPPRAPEKEQTATAA